MQVPHKLMQKVAAAEGIELPAAGQYGVGAVYGSPDPATRLPRGAATPTKSRQIFADVVAAEGLKVLGWRDVLTDNGSLGETARSLRDDESFE